MEHLKDPEKFYCYNPNPTIEFTGNKVPWIAPYCGQPERYKIFDLEAAMLKLPQINLKVIHHFSKGVYARELIIPADVTLIGEIHKFENLNILSQGTMLVTTEDGVKEVSAPFTVVSPPGTKRAAHTLTECVWTTIHGTEETNIDLIKNHFIAANEQEWLEFCNANQLELGFK